MRAAAVQLQSTPDRERNLEAADRLTREAAVQGDLFDAGRRQRQESLDRTIDTIRGQFGDAAIRRGSLLDRGANGSR